MVTDILRFEIISDTEARQIEPRSTAPQKVQDKVTTINWRTSQLHVAEVMRTGLPWEGCPDAANNALVAGDVYKYIRITPLFHPETGDVVGAMSRCERVA